MPASCVTGEPGKGFQGEGPGIGPLRKGELGAFGYHDVKHLPTKTRRAALRKAVDKYGALSIFRKLNAVAIYDRNTAKQASRIFLSDRNWVRRTYMKRR